MVKPNSQSSIALELIRVDVPEKKVDFNNCHERIYRNVTGKIRHGK